MTGVDDDNVDVDVDDDVDDVDADVDDGDEDVDSLQVVVDDDNHDVRWQRDATHAAKSGRREARSQKTVSDSDNSLLRQLFRSNRQLLRSPIAEA